MCAFFLSLFFASKRLYVFRVLEVFRSFLWFLHELSLDKQKKNSLSLVDFIIHISDLSFSSLSKPHFTRVLVLWPPRESLFFRKKKRGTPKTPAKLCCFDSFFGEGARAFRKRKRERERDGVLFLRRERDLGTFR